MESFKGRMGTGLIDASHALDNVEILLGVPATHVAPAPIENLEFVESTPYTLTVKWKVTADCENNPLSLYKAYIGLIPIEYNDRNDISSASYYGPELINTSGLKVGDEVTWTASDILPGREYYVAIVGVDRWRQVSELVNFGTYPTEPEPNISPVITPDESLPAELVIQYWQKKTLTFTVTDEDDKEWEAALDDPTGTWSLKRQGKVLTLTYDKTKGYVGSAVLTLRVTDIRGAQTELKIPFKVVANVAPVLGSPIKDVHIQRVGETVTVNLNDYFTDANEETLQYLCTTQGTAAAATVKEGILTLTGKQNGRTTVRVQARDICGEQVETTFTVVVGQNDSSSGLTLYPNPVSDVLNIRVNADMKEAEQVRFYGSTGSLMFETKADFSGNQTVRMNVASLNPGSYIVEVRSQGVSYKGNIIKK